MPNRRDFLTASATLAAASASSWFGWRYLNPQPVLHINHAGLPGGHLLRDRKIRENVHSTHSCRTLILGSGAAGLGAAWHLSRQGYRDFLLAEGFERNGNNAAFVSGSLKAPTGAHYLAQPSPESGHVRLLLKDLGILQHETADGRASYRETDLVHAPDERVFYQGRWFDGLLPMQDADSCRFFDLVHRLQHSRGSDGRKLFAIPIALSSQDSELRRLDTQTFADWLAAEGYRSADLLHYLDYCCRDDYGQGIDTVSAFAGLHYFCARGNEQAAVLTWPDGLNHLSEGMRALCGLQNTDRLPENPHWQFERPLCAAAAALSIHETDAGVQVLLHNLADGKTVAVTAENVICAMPLNIAGRIVQNPQQYGFMQPEKLLPQAPWLVSNFVLHRFPNEPENGTLAWDNIVHPSKGLGYVVATHQQIHVAKPPKTIFTAYTALNHDSPTNVRRWLMNADKTALLTHAAQDLTAVYGRHFWQCVESVDITVRGHAMAVPLPGYLNHPVLHALRQHQSRLLFAHSDLSGYSVFEEALWWGVQAAEKLLEK